MSGFGFAEKLGAINQAGVRLAREASEGGPFVAGAMGPLGVHLEPLGPTSFAEARAIFREQAEALIARRRRSAGARDLRRLQRTARSDLRGSRGGRPGSGDRGAGGGRRFRPLPVAHRSRPSAREMDAWPADVIGLNCSVGPKTTLEVIEQMARLSSEAAERHAQRRHSDARGGPQHLFVLAGIYGPVRAPAAVGGRENHRRLLRHHARAHQADSFRNVVRSQPREGIRAAREWRKPARTESQALRCRSAGGKIQVRRQAGGGQIRALSWKSCRRGIGCIAAKSPAHACAPSTASIASTFRTAPAPARASAPRPLAS